MPKTDNLDDTGERLISEGNEQTLTYGEHLSRYFSVHELATNKTILDVASGTGYGSKLLAEKAKSVTGIDYSMEAIDYSKKHNNRNNIKYVVGDAHAMPFTEDAFDLVVSFETIEHLQHPEKFVKEVKRVMSPKGTFVVSTPNDDEFMEGNQFHIHEFNLTELKRLIEQNFKYSQFYYQGTFFSASLLPEQLFTNGGTWNGLAHKTFKQEKNKAIFFIVVASDEPIANNTLTNNVVLADFWSTKDDAERDKGRQAAMEASRLEIKEVLSKYEDLKANRDQLEQEIIKIHSSLLWKSARSIKHPLRTIRKILQ